MTQISGTDRRIRVNAAKFAAAYLFAGTDETRYYLNGVYIQPHHERGVTIVATNGRMLGCIYDAEGEANAPFICKVSQQFRAACSVKPSKRAILERPGDIHFVGRTAFLTADGFDEDPTTIGAAHIAIEYAPEIDGTFPSWRRLLPNFDPLKTPDWNGVNGDLLSPFVRAAQLVSGSGSRQAVTMRPSERGGPILIRNSSVPEFFGVLMPMRDFDAVPNYPEWLSESETEKEAAE